MQNEIVINLRRESGVVDWLYGHALAGWWLAVTFLVMLGCLGSELYKAQQYKPELDRTRAALAQATQMLGEKGGGK